MRKKIAVVAIGLVLAGTIWLFTRQKPLQIGFDASKNVLPVQTRQILDRSETFTLISLDPTRPEHHPAPHTFPKERFHGFAVLGSAAIHDPDQRLELLRALYEGIADSDGLVAKCFNPRHGIRVTASNETVDLVICFECRQVETHASHGKNVLTSDSPEPIFTQALERAGLPLPPKS